jgi:membrane carboxypeptidase/penicillin-binding protein
MSTERRQMDDEATSNEEIQPADEGTTPQPSAPESMSDRSEQTTADESVRESVLPADRTAGYRRRWDDIQSRFVDDPRSSVEQADTLVLEVVQDLQTTFGSERSSLEAQWQSGEDVQTEDLRMALRRYRSFFDRLLSA